MASCLPGYGQTQLALDWQPFPAALSDAASAERPALIYVHAVWCSPCRRLERETFSDPDIAATLRRFALGELTFDDHDQTHRIGDYRLNEAAWAAHLGAESTPALIFLGPDGAVLARQHGFLPPAGLMPILDAVLQAVATPGTSQ